ncbi:MAG: hypothetical protein P0Y55_12030 [Candidatus Cohnella colombiensis]|uniref:Uncharacterized protein n=1 Tax=Candidatus Cohnella colombiensis TaxID=3121368 RepID=A0AA95F227_9BACL|nr:MAG: hypothetical protein P0Y55_12030 [Cohnella sp.]
MAWIAPKMDWTELDSINSTDFNRIENNTQEVVNFLNSIQYAMPTLTIVTNRTQNHVDFLSSINRIEQNLETIRTRFVNPEGYLGVKTWASKMGFTNEDANRLETNVKLLMDFGILVYQSFRYCGTFSCGEEWGRL